MIRKRPDFVHFLQKYLPKSVQNKCYNKCLTVKYKHDIINITRERQDLRNIL